MATLNLKALSAGISLFALCMMGTVSLNAKTSEGDKKDKEVKIKNSDKVKKQVVLQWFTVSYNATTGKHDILTPTSAPAPGDPCNTLNTGTMCKVAFQQGVTPPTTVESANPSDIKARARQEAP